MTDNDALVRELTNRFLAWKLPADFNPDGGAGGTSLAKATAAITALRQHSGESALREENARLREALVIADAAIKEMFRYYDGGETRGSYDGKPERNQLRKAGYATTAALAKQETGHG